MSDAIPIAAMPPEISKAFILVMRAVGRLVRDAKNQHDGYAYASTDAFFEALNPACAEAGLIIKPRCLSSHLETIEVFDKHTKAAVQKRMLRAVYLFLIIHESGAQWVDPMDLRTIIVNHTGPQSFGAAESYAQKVYMRSLFLIATGDKDADAQEQHQAEIIRATVKAVRAKKENGESHILLDFGTGLEPVPAADVTDRVIARIVEIGDSHAALSWWQDQKHGRETFFNEFPKLAHELKKKVEAFVASQQAPE